MENLYVFGNGFDLFHGIESKYSHFREFVRNNDIELFDALEKYFNPEQLWWNFEAELAELDTDSITEDASQFLESYSAEDWSDSMHSDYQYEIGKVVDMFTGRLYQRFAQWILQIQIPRVPDQRLAIRPNSLYLNFNYTKTLEITYGIAGENITYIHNKALDERSNLILGHDMLDKYKKAPVTEEDGHDVRVSEGEDLLIEYFKSTYKSTSEIIVEYEEFFKALKAVKNIFIYGHSISRIDLKYFEEIVKWVDINSTQWYVSAFTPDDLEHHKKQLNSIGVPLNRMTVDEITKLDSLQLEIPY